MITCIIVIVGIYLYGIWISGRRAVVRSSGKFCSDAWKYSILVLAAEAASWCECHFDSGELPV